MISLIIICTIIDAEGIYPRAQFGAGSKAIWLSNVTCVGTEDSLLQCKFDFAEAQTCPHSRDVGVKCQGQRSMQQLTHLSDFSMHYLQLFVTIAQFV